MAALVQRIFNWFGMGLMLLGAAALLNSDSHVLPTHFVLLAAVPLVIQIFARAPEAPVGLRIAAMLVNWVAAVLAGSLAAVALTGIGGGGALTPLLGSAAVLYGWNAVSVAMTSI